MPKPRSNSPTLRAHRPIDLIAAPKLPSMTTTRDLPKSWQTFFDEATDWPYIDPDENGLADPEPSFVTYEPSADIEPFSEDEPWGIMATETDREYALFSHYRSLGITRTRTATAKHFSISTVHISKVSKERNWDARCRAWDDYREKIYTAELIMGVKEMAHKHAEIAREGVTALATTFEAIVSQLANEEDREQFLAQLAELPVKTQLAIAQRSAQVIPNLMSAERLSRGLPTEISAELHLTDARVTIQTTDDLYAIISGLAGPLAVARSSDPEEEIIEVES